MITLIGTELSKSYRRRRVLQNISVSATGGDVVGIIGPNGSGKSTLARILAGVLRPDSGSVTLTVQDATVPTGDHPFYVGMVAPYLQIYDEFTPLELLELQRRLHSEPLDRDAMEATLQAVGLLERRTELVRTFSSGLRQRVLLALAVHRQPPLLILDEPTITLDEAGIAIVEQQISVQRARGGITLIATNDARERTWCSHTISV